jgi:Undecaprenyl-phosphate galactose phosphotransferase WbaP
MEELIDDLPAPVGVVLDHEVTSHALAKQKDSSSVAALARQLEAAAEQDIDAHLPDADANSIPQAVAVRTAMIRWVRTTAPFVVSDVVALLLAGILTQAFVHFVYPPAAHLLGWRVAPLCLLPLSIAYATGGLYSAVWTHVVIELRQLSHLTTICLLAAAVGGVATWPLPVWCIAAWPFVVTIVPIVRTITHALCQRRRWWGYPTLVIGTGVGADTVVQALLAAPRSGLRPVLVTDPAGGNVTTSVLPVINDPVTLESIIRTEGIRHAVVSLPDLPHRRLSEAMDRYTGLVPHVLQLSDCSTLPSLWSAARNGGRLSGIEVRNGLLLNTLQVLKRALDVSVVLTAFVVFAPLFILSAVLIKLTSPGPVFFGHKRIGRGGRLFKAWKFRTMHTNGDEILLKHLEANPAARAEWAAEMKLSDDPRVFGVGKWLRKLSFDELPQLWNVLRGDMSLVGPRPIVQAEIWRYGKVFRLYTTVKPGITGLWQASGRNNVSYDERVLLDEFYIRHWSLWLDVYIVAKTVVALLSRRGAY